MQHLLISRPFADMYRDGSKHLQTFIATVGEHNHVSSWQQAQPVSSPLRTASFIEPSSRLESTAFNQPGLEHLQIMLPASSCLR